MFTGIVEEVGRVVRAVPRANGMELEIAAERVTADLCVGSSVAVQGVCQTVLAHGPHSFQVAAESETLRVTTLGALRAGARVNLERALPATGRLDGHFVLGHVDGTARVVTVREDARTRILALEIPAELRPYVVPKGCIAVDGVSLTVGPSVRDGCIELFLIPHTWDATTLALLAAGSQVNIETDVLGRYAAHLLGVAVSQPAPVATTVTWDALQRAFGEEGRR